MTDFWSTPEAVTRNRRDTILKRLEIRVIASFVKDGDRVLDVGCGDGETAVALVKAFKRLDIVGVDSSAEMLKAAESRMYAENDFTEQPGPLKDISSIRFERCAVADVSAWAGARRFDVIYTERCLINLLSREAQNTAVSDLLALVASGGSLVLCEHSMDGLVQLNERRCVRGLAPVEMPSFNLYLSDAQIEQWRADMSGVTVTVDDFARDYQYRSRILNAADAAEHGMEPSYDAPINTDERIKAPGGFRGYARCLVVRRC